MAATLSRRSFLGDGLALAAALAGCATPTAPGAGALPGRLVLSTYRAGSGLYADIAAVANALTGRMGVQVRVMPGVTGVSRLAPLFTDTAQYTRVGDEYFFAFEGNEEFASGTWGPQPVRLVWTPPSNAGVFVRRDSGIESLEDLKGRRISWVVAGTSTQRKFTACLATAGLSVDDVRRVAVAEGAQYDAIKAGQIEAIFGAVVNPSIEEVHSQYPIRWLDLGGRPEERYESWAEYAPMAGLGTNPKASGLPEDETPTFMRYSLPVVTTAGRSAAEVADLCRALYEHFDAYEAATADTPNFALDRLMLEPFVVPYHPGAVEFLREAGRWDAHLEERNAALLEREGLLQDAWPGFFERHRGDGEISRRWRDFKAERLPALPEREA